MEEEENAGGVTAGSDRPFARHAVEIDRVERDVVGHRPDGADLVEPPAPFGPADGSRLGGQQRADGIDFALAHRQVSRTVEAAIVPILSEPPSLFVRFVLR